MKVIGGARDKGGVADGAGILPGVAGPDQRTEFRVIRADVGEIRIIRGQCRIQGRIGESRPGEQASGR